jgi:hypothetical protein
MKEVLLNIRDTKLENHTIGKIKHNVELRISRCEPNSEGIIIWVEFSVPRTSTSACVGTMEMISSWTGEFKITGIIGEEVTEHC